MNSPPPDAPGASPEDDVSLAHRAREQVLTVEGVAALGRGHLAEAATYWVGTKVIGVVVEPDRLEVHLVAGYPEGFPIPDLARRVRERLAHLSGGRRMDIVVDDVAFASDIAHETGQAVRPGNGA